MSFYETLTRRRATRLARLVMRHKEHVPGDMVAQAFEVLILADDDDDQAVEELRPGEAIAAVLLAQCRLYTRVAATLTPEQEHRLDNAMRDLLGISVAEAAVSVAARVPDEVDAETFVRAFVGGCVGGLSALG
jgi:hypothetical protein